MNNIEKRLEKLGIVLPEASTPIANYVTFQRSGNTIYFSGAGAFTPDGKPVYTGKLGAEISIEQGYDAARIAAITLIANLKKAVGDLDKVKKIVKILGFVASADDFCSQPAVINGASDLFVQVFGDAGKHARSAVGVNVLPLNLPVEVEMIVEVED